MEKLRELDLKKIGGWAMVVSSAIVLYYGLSIYKTYLEIKKLRNEEGL